MDISLSISLYVSNKGGWVSAKLMTPFLNDAAAVE